MSGFKNFILRGNLVEIAVGLIMALSFAEVVSSFTAWLTGLLPGGFEDVFAGFFLNKVVAFVIMGAIVYFLVVVPYTKAKEKFFPSEPEGTPADIALLEEIRDAL